MTPPTAPTPTQMHHTIMVRPLAHTGTARFLGRTLFVCFIVYILINETKKIHNYIYTIDSDHLFSDAPLQLQLQQQSNICPHVFPALIQNATALQNAIVAARAFHSEGGNLKALEMYLDAQLQPSYEAHDFQFLPQAAAAAATTKKRKGNDNTHTHTDTEPISNIIPYLHEHYSNNQHLYSKRGGYGQPLPGVFVQRNNNIISINNNNKKFLTDGRWIDVIEPQTMERWNVSMGPQAKLCDTITTFGKSYETKHLCTPPPIITHQKECHMLSIGSNDQWGFEKDVLIKLPHCHTHTFDCTLPGPPKKKPESDKIHFYPYCISTTTHQKHGRNYVTYQEMWNMTGIAHQGGPTVLKMDIEGFEYDVWANSILQAPSSLWPEQVAMELHFATRMVDLSWMLRQRQAGELALFFALLFQKGGYMIVLPPLWQTWPTLVEILMMRVLC